MMRLPQSEFILFIAVNFVYLAATVVGVLQVVARRDSHRGLITHFIAIGVALEAVLLILILYLGNDLRFAHHHRIQTGGNPQQMGYRVVVSVNI